MRRRGVFRRAPREGRTVVSVGCGVRRGARSVRRKPQRKIVVRYDVSTRSLSNGTALNYVVEGDDVSLDPDALVVKVFGYGKGGFREIKRKTYG